MMRYRAEVTEFQEVRVVNAETGECVVCVFGIVQVGERIAELLNEKQERIEMLERQLERAELDRDYYYDKYYAEVNGKAK